MLSVKDSIPTATKKRIIKLTNISVADSKFVDEDGDVTDKILDALPDGVETVDFKITIDLGDDDAE